MNINPPRSELLRVVDFLRSISHKGGHDGGRGWWGSDSVGEEIGVLEDGVLDIVAVGY